MMEDEAIAAQLEQLVTPAVIAQERYYRQRLSRLYGDKYCLFEWLEWNGNYLNKQANSFSFIRSKFLNP